MNLKRKKSTENILDYPNLVADSNIEENVIKDENVKRILFALLLIVGINKVSAIEYTYSEWSTLYPNLSFIVL